MKVTRWGAIVAGAMILAGCTGGVERNMEKAGKFFSVQFEDTVNTARKLPPPGADWKAVREQPANGPGFAAHLSRDYKSLMLFEADQMYDDVSAHMYAERAIATANGASVDPVNLDDFMLPESHLGALQRARADIAELFGQGSRDRFPAESARLQSSFDCWVEQQEENHQPDHIAACRDEFVTAQKQLTELMKPAPAAPARAAPPAAPAPRDSYTVYFALDSDRLSEEAGATIAEVIQALQSQNAGASIIGYTDTLGTAAYNLSLSQRRAKAISDRLLNAGIRPAVVTTEGRGQTELAVPTADNVNEPRNRRAVVNIR